jgi:hypothetical protein
MSKRIQLTKGHVTIVDNEDFDWLINHNWHAHDANLYMCYARSRIKGKHIRMHRLILQHHGLLEDGLVVDHIDGNGMNNQKANLRPCTQAENLRNRKGPFKNGYRGITRSISRKNPWMAQLSIDGKRKYLGIFPTREAAARAYDQAARKHHGEFATLNFSDEMIEFGEADNVEDTAAC